VATDEAVLAWLAGSTNDDRGVLHLACHGVVEPGRPDSSYLFLANGRRLSAERVIEAVESTPGYRLAVVTLAACSTGLPTRGYDEAFSLATVFLAAGARSVVGSLWPVPDESTSLLMYMFHHYLGVDRLGTASALRLAQLWMLDPGRRVPERMPDQLRARVAHIDVDDPTTWAGFSHYGQW
jgi:CHAT domain-containing protein